MVKLALRLDMLGLKWLLRKLALGFQSILALLILRVLRIVRNLWRVLVKRLIVIPGLRLDHLVWIVVRNLVLRMHELFWDFRRRLEMPLTLTYLCWCDSLIRRVEKSLRLLPQLRTVLVLVKRLSFWLPQFKV